MHQIRSANSIHGISTPSSTTAMEKKLEAPEPGVHLGNRITDQNLIRALNLKSRALQEKRIFVDVPALHTKLISEVTTTSAQLASVIKKEVRRENRSTPMRAVYKSYKKLTQSKAEIAQKNADADNLRKKAIDLLKQCDELLNQTEDSLVSMQTSEASSNIVPLNPIPLHSSQ